MDYFFAIGEYVAIAVGLMSGILSIWREWLTVYHPERVAPQSLFWSSVRIAFILAAFFAWYAEHYKLKQAVQTITEKTQQLDRLTNPILSGKINATSIAPAGQHGEDSLVTAFGVIKNLGAASILSDWTVKLRFSYSRIVVGDALIMPRDHLDLMDEHGKPFMTLPMGTFWPFMTRSTPIVNGGGVDGWIISRFRDLNEKQIMEGKPIIIISATDVTGKILSIEWPMVGEVHMPSSLGQAQGYLGIQDKR